MLRQKLIIKIRLLDLVGFSLSSHFAHDARSQQSVCFDFLYKFVGSISNLTRNERNMIKKTYIPLHVKYPQFVSYFNEIVFFATDFRKTVNPHKLHMFKAANLKLPKSALSVKLLVYIQRYLVRN